ncbi:MAG TPA: ribonuclease H [Bdellovibrio sp.]
MLWLQRFFQKPLEVYTDGSLKFGRGAWAFVVVEKNKTIIEKFGTAKNTTSNRMEFQAVIEALILLPKDRALKIHTDSRVLLEALAKIPTWKLRGWIKKNSSPIPSVDQMILLDQLLQNRQVQWQWVKAHSGVQYNERCDELCILARS